MKMDPPAESGAAPAHDKTTGNFSDQTTGSFSDRTSVTPLLLSRPKIVLWGDSLTQTSFEGWGAKLAHRYQRRADVVNRGMSGYNTAWFLQLPGPSSRRPEENVVLCTIWFGANDASLEELNPHHHVSVDDYQQNLHTLVQKAKKLFCNPEILLITPPPVDHDQRLEFQKQRYGPKATGVLERTLENSGRYAEACQQVATELSLPCLNLWREFQSESSASSNETQTWSRFLSDGLHLSPAGHDFVFTKLMETIQTEFPHLYVEPDPITGQACNSGSKCSGLQPFGPYHDEIDETCPDVAMKKAFNDLKALELTTAKAAADADADNSGGGGGSISSGDDGEGGSAKSSSVDTAKSPTMKKPKMDAP